MLKLQQLRNLLSKGRTEEVLGYLQKITVQDRFLNDQVIALQGRLQKVKRDQNIGLVSIKEADLELNQINYSILDIINQCTDNDAPPHSSRTISFALGLGFLAGIVILLLFVPCPSASQFFAFRIVLALVSSGLAIQMLSIFQLEVKAIIKIITAFAFFNLIYFTNPASLINTKRCTESSFSFTIQLQKSPGLLLHKLYPALENPSLEIWIDNYWKPADALLDGIADFKTLPSEKFDTKVPVRLKGDYWVLTQDSVFLKEKSQILYIQPDNSLALISGKVLDENGGAPLINAKIETATLTSISDADGNFNLNVPLEFQQLVYDVYVNRSGYAPWKGTASPGLGKGLVVLLSKKNSLAN